MVSLAYAEPVEIRRGKKSTHLTIGPEKYKYTGCDIYHVRANNMQDLIYKRGLTSVNKTYVAPVASDDKDMKDNSTRMIKKFSHSDQNGKSASKLKEFASNSSVHRGSSFSSSTHMSNTEKKRYKSIEVFTQIIISLAKCLFIMKQHAADFKMQQPLQHENPQISNTNAPTIHTTQNTLTPQIITTRGTNSTRLHSPIVMGFAAWVQLAGAGIGAATAEIIATPSYNNSSNMSAVPVITISAPLTPDPCTEELLEALTIEQLSMIERTMQYVKRKKVKESKKQNPLDEISNVTTDIDSLVVNINMHNSTTQNANFKFYINFTGSPNYDPRILYILKPS
ncbi:13621_t:CDS:2 [Funneliformis geosporum]|uniref:13621_t:CDS:1 n=1 Tax=Funneliformis geosporum TaxID=1117311 RepID=A0A9W4WS77_9GLOM|nr:13621_t:CDS:2 [Funneliformis geosporum]